MCARVCICIHDCDGDFNGTGYVFFAFTLANIHLVLAGGLFQVIMDF